MAKTKEAKPKGKRPRQKALPGLEEETIQAIQDAGENYEDCATEAATAKAAETNAKEMLIICMAKHGRDRYRLASGDIIMISAKKAVKIVKAKEPKAK